MVAGLTSLRLVRIVRFVRMLGPTAPVSLQPFLLLLLDDLVLGDGMRTVNPANANESATVRWPLKLFSRPSYFRSWVTPSLTCAIFSGFVSARMEGICQPYPSSLCISVVVLFILAFFAFSLVNIARPCLA